jgi:hypothetical protein
VVLPGPRDRVAENAVIEILMPFLAEGIKRNPANPIEGALKAYLDHLQRSFNSIKWFALLRLKVEEDKSDA